MVFQGAQVRHPLPDFGTHHTVAIGIYPSPKSRFSVIGLMDGNDNSGFNCLWGNGLQLRRVDRFYGYTYDQDQGNARMARLRAKNAPGPG
jgi:hypothetical protein